MKRSTQERVIAEKEELDVKLKALIKFIDSEEFEGLKPPEGGRLIRQRGVMTQYSRILEQRIEAFQLESL